MQSALRAVVCRSCTSRCQSFAVAFGCSDGTGLAASAPKGATSASAAAAAIAATYDPLDIRTISVAFFRAKGRNLAGHRGKSFVKRPAVLWVLAQLRVGDDLAVSDGQEDGEPAQVRFDELLERRRRPLLVSRNVGKRFAADVVGALCELGTIREQNDLDPIRRAGSR